MSRKLGLALAALLAVPLELACETLTLSTTYPSPAGIYNQIITTGSGAKDTLLARDSGRVVVGSSAGGANKLVVNGGTRLVGDASVAGDVDAKGILIDGVRLVWKDLVLPATPPSATYSPWSGVYPGPARADDCDGSPSAVYSCPAGLTTRKTCVDVASGGMAAGTETDLYAPESSLGRSGGSQDTCPSGGSQEPFTCPAGVNLRCRDTWCSTSRSGSECFTRDVTCRTYGPSYQDRTVVCDPGVPGTRIRVLTSASS